MSAAHPTALVADDEPLLRTALVRALATEWPELDVVAECRNGRDAVERFEALQPDICFLDVQMPGLSGLDAAALIGRRAQLVFVTAFDRYAVQAFAHGALDYLVKPVESGRLADTVARLRERLRSARPSADTDALIAELAVRLARGAPPPGLRWLRASVGSTVRVIGVDEIDFLRADEKYTRIGWRGDAGPAADALVRTPLKELLAQLDPERFVQVHRAVVVNLRAIDHVVKHDNDTAEIHLKGRAQTLPVSRAFVHVFRQM